MLLGLLAFAGMASAAVTIEEVEFDDDELSDSGTNFVRDIERGEEFTVKVHLRSDEDLENVQVEAELRGYDHDDRVEDITDVFDMDANVTYVKKLDLRFPQRIDKDGYGLTVEVSSRSGQEAVETYNLNVDAERHNIAIRDVVFSPEGSVKAGRALLASVRLTNYGDEEEETIKVKVAIPDLGISASDYVDELDSDDSTTSEELYLRIPTCTRAGVYDVEVTVEYDDFDERTTELSEIRVIEDDTCEINANNGGQGSSAAKPSIVYDASTQDAAQGGPAAAYAVTVANPTDSAKTVTLMVAGVDAFGEARISPSNVLVVSAGESKTAFVYVTADEDAEPGQYGFTVSVAGLASAAQDIALSANVVESEDKGNGSLRTALEIGLIILVVILVIIGLIVGFNKLREDEDEPEEEAQTYY